MFVKKSNFACKPLLHKHYGNKLDYNTNCFTNCYRVILFLIRRDQKDKEGVTSTLDTDTDIEEDLDRHKDLE